MTLSACRCVGCTEWKTRVLNSQAISVMVTAQNVEAILRTVLGLLDSQLVQNQLHGLLLTVDTLVTDHLHTTNEGGPSIAFWLLASLAHQGWIR